jgi:hypothetical protein
MERVLPVRATGAGARLRPARLPLVAHGRPLKRWRYVAAFGARWVLCAAVVRIGPGGQWFWALWDRDGRVLREGTRPLLPAGPRARVAFGPGGRLRVADGPVRMDLVVSAGGGVPVETLSPHPGGGPIWTRKLGGADVRGTLAVDGEGHAFAARGIVDESAGHHARVTEWRWSAGVGRDADGAEVAWNLVDGVHDAPVASERTLWVDGAPTELGPVAFAPGLRGVTFAGGTAALAFTAEATRSRRDDLLVVRSDYTAPFGTFTGRFPDGRELRDGIGVMEHHRARW